MTKYYSQVQWDGNNPYLPITPELRLTPTRASDVQEWCDLLNTPSISANDWTSPKPYTLELAQKNVDRGLASEKPAVDALRADRAAIIAGCPFGMLREVATGRIVGYCKLSKVEDYLVPPAADTVLRLPYEPAPLPPDGPATPAEDAPTWADDTWNIGYGIHPEWEGKGITQKMAKAMIEGWVIPHMKLHHITAGSAHYNKASQHVLRKSGFHQVYGYYRKDYYGEPFDALKFQRRL